MKKLLIVLSIIGISLSGQVVTPPSGGGGGGGVTSIAAGTGISVDHATGAVTVTNTAPGASPAGSPGCVQLYGTSTTFACGPLTFANVTDAGGYVLTAGAALPPFEATPGGLEGGTSGVFITPSDYWQFVFAATSDGFGGGQWNSTFIAKAGDVIPTGGAAATPGALEYIGGFWMQQEDTTQDATRLDWGINMAAGAGLPGEGTNRPIAGNGLGDVGIGLVQLTFPSGMPTVVSNANLFLKADGTVATMKGVLQTGGYKSSDGTVGTSGNGFKNGLCTTASGACTGGLSPVLSGTTGSIGGGLLTAGSCTSGTVSIGSSTTSMVALADPNTYPGDGLIWDAQITSNGTATVKVCAIVALTPAASTYNVRVIQ